MTWRIDGPQGNESGKVKYDIVPYTRGMVLDLGCGPWKPYEHFIGWDSGDEWQGLPWSPDIRGDCSNLSIIASKSVDSVFSAHLLEHIKDTRKTLTEWWRVIKEGGYLVLYLPHKDAYPNIGQEGSNPDHKHDFMPKDIITAMSKVAGTWDLLVNENRFEGDEYSFLQVYRKGAYRGQAFSCDMKRPERSACIVRYGGIGDMIQTSSILPGLKDQGYHITVNCVPMGYEIIKSDPHVDDFIIQDRNQIPSAELRLYWANLAKKFDLFINLTETVEVGLLVVPGMSSYLWPKALRHKFFNINYMEVTHELAGVPLPPRHFFYPTRNERLWAEKQYTKLNQGAPIIMWVMSGSSVHKAWPYLDSTVAKIMLDYPEGKLVMVGDELSQVLEAGWENEPRVIKKCGKWGIRKTLAIAEFCDIVIGPETGVLNAVGMLNMPKIVTLSHSTAENLTKYWINTTALAPVLCNCYPCHQLNTTFEECPRDEETGTAVCQAMISGSRMWEAISGYMNQIRIKREAV